MFLEPHIKGKGIGWIEVVCGSMFSGKTEELIRRLRRAKIANQQVGIFKPAIDTRYDEESIVSHNKTSISSTPVSSSQQILLLASSVEVVGIDEAQFFDEGIVDVALTLANRGQRVIVAGLDMDFSGKPFGPMPALLSIADFVTKVHAICQRCGNLAQFSYRISKSQNQVLLGEKEAYEPRCRKCFCEGQFPLP